MQLKKILFTLITFVVVAFLAPPLSLHAQSPSPSTSESQDQQPAVSLAKPEYFRGNITNIIEEQRVEVDSDTFYVQKAKVHLTTNQDVEIQAGTEFAPLNPKQKLTTGAQIIVAKVETTPGNQEYVFVDFYRIPSAIWLLVGFLALVLVIAHKQGLFSIIGMLLSLLVLVGFIVPQILAGQNPFLISLIGCSVVALLSVYLSHGWRLESHIALFSMFLSLVAVAVLSTLSVRIAHLTGLGSEDALFLQFGPTSKINLQGLLLGGIMLGALGVLDDICLAQVSIVHQLRMAKPDISFQELYERAITVGKDHVASLVNTLILAYAGTSLPLFLLFTLSEGTPFWVSFNSEVIMEEVVRTLAGSIGLVLAVPLTTLAAAYFALHVKQWNKTSASSHTHSHI
jgi:uncharacterized membrane protein